MLDRLRGLAVKQLGRAGVEQFEVSFSSVMVPTVEREVRTGFD
jgi:hypothetical protein